MILAGKTLVKVEAFSHRPQWQHDTDDTSAHDQRLTIARLAALPVGTLLVFDRGFFSVLWFADFTGSQKFFGTRTWDKTACRTGQVLSRGPYDRDDVVEVSQYRSNPCQYPLRLVSV